MVSPSLSAALLSLLFSGALGQQNFTVSNGQIFTPGFAIVDSPQPGTPLGGSQIEVALDVSADGVLPLNTAVDSPSQINNITIFMYSYDTGRNFTISNGTITNATYGPIMQQEPGSTVKHVKWTWPSCLIGNGQPTTADSARGIYNISIRQNFRMNNTSYYTIFDLPISVTNSIDNSTSRPDCDSINNPLLTPEQINATIANRVGILFAPGDSQIVEVKLNKTDPSTGGLGGAATLRWEASAMWLCGLVFFAALVM
ncbi:hypothetical protein N0V93_003899 [Gnomoniopsis smithogilvyi]|uniref:Uncharacterized protein n=1 Tax=Gnomoniopsis smithogilvyi TaxID=1191159 RepID=A0A9W8YXH5_9PEZI|nr:hypothetical protein N0V93_003899 [Gnomoniopsis smithogilvyi]